MRNLALAGSLMISLVMLTGCGSGGSTPRAATPASAPSALLTSMAVSTADATALAGSGAPLVKVVDRTDGKRILTDIDGKTLYMTSADAPATGVSACTGDCASTWPPLTIPFGHFFQVSGLGVFGEFLRKDGNRQLMYRGRPLYYYAGDKMPGDAKGDGIDGHWSIAVP